MVIGSGFGGTMAAHELVAAGLDVLMLERGDWVPRGPHNWDDTGSVDLTPFYSHEAPYRVAAGGNGPSLGSYSCVGGPSVFYGGVSIRFREDDFVADPDIVGDSGAAWPYDYAELEPWYARAENLLGVAGEADEDPTEPRRSTPYPQDPGALSDTSARIAARRATSGCLRSGSRSRSTTRPATVATRASRAPRATRSRARSEPRTISRRPCCPRSSRAASSCAPTPS